MFPLSRLRERAGVRGSVRKHSMHVAPPHSEARRRCTRRVRATKSPMHPSKKNLKPGKSDLRPRNRNLRSSISILLASKESLRRRNAGMVARIGSMKIRTSKAPASRERYATLHIGKDRAHQRGATPQRRFEAEKIAVARDQSRNAHPIPEAKKPHHCGSGLHEERLRGLRGLRLLRLRRLREAHAEVTAQFAQPLAGTVSLS